MLLASSKTTSKLFRSIAILMLKKFNFQSPVLKILKGEVTNKNDPAVDGELSAADFLIIYIGVRTRWMYMDNLKNGEKEVWCLFLTSNHDTS